MFSYDSQSNPQESTRCQSNQKFPFINHIQKKALCVCDSPLAYHSHLQPREYNQAHA